MQRPTRSAAQRLSSWAIFAVGLLTLVGLGTSRLLRDGSFWLDEASIALNLLELSPLEILGPLDTGHSFPRLHLLFLRLLVDAVGYSTFALRLPSYIFFVAATLLWLNLLRTRFADRPGLLGTAVLLNLIPATWIVYSAQLKQYPLDVLLALLPFALSDQFFERAFGRGERAWRSALLLAAPCALSYTYVIALLGRLVGWLVVRWRGGGALPSGRATIALASGLALSLGSLWLTDIRHSLGAHYLVNYWRECILTASPTDAGILLDRFAFGWYDGRHGFGRGVGVAVATLAGVRVAFALGLFAIARTLAPGERTPPWSSAWGSRSVGCAMCVGGLIAGSVLVQYPICAGRLTLFALLPLQIIALEGLQLVLDRSRRLRCGAWINAALIAAIAASLAPAAARNTRRFWRSDVPENVRPLLPKLAGSDLPIVVTPCSHRQIQTLPEWQGRSDIFYWSEHVPWVAQEPSGQEVWIIDPARSPRCRWFWLGIEKVAEEQEHLHRRFHTAGLHRVKFRAREDTAPSGSSTEEGRDGAQGRGHGAPQHEDQDRGNDPADEDPPRPQPGSRG